MIPLRDTIPSRHFPIVNYTMIGLCAFAFWAELTAGAALDEMLHVYGLIPARFHTLSGRVGWLHADLYTPFITSTFLHGGWMHFLGNMLYLWIFGDNVEDRFGHVGYAAFYLAGGVAAGVAHLLFNPGSVVPTIGASGAIAAVMGAYFILYPRARIVSLAIVFFWIQIISVPAFFYLAFWFILQLAAGTVALGTMDAAEGGVAWWAHLGGFAFGAVAVLVVGRASPTRNRSGD